VGGASTDERVHVGLAHFQLVPGTAIELRAGENLNHAREREENHWNHGVVARLKTHSPIIKGAGARTPIHKVICQPASWSVEGVRVRGGRDRFG